MMERNEQQQPDVYVPGNTDDPVYFGARAIVETELNLINSRYEGDGVKKKTKDLAGLALSGGGIRSASFCLGVMQALAYKNWLHKIDYLSTVSGGGYIGSSLTWLLSRTWNSGGGDTIDFDTSRKQFPYGTYPMSGSAYEKDAPIQKLQDRIKDTANEKVRGKMLRYLRQNAKYLTPGKGLNVLTLLAVALRSILLGLITYLSLLLIFFFLYQAINPKFIDILNCTLSSWNICPAWSHFNIFLAPVVLGVGIYVVLLPIYSLGTFIIRWANREEAYDFRRIYEVFMGYMLPLIIVFAILGIIPMLSTWLNSLHDSKEASTFSGFLSLVVGMISGIAAFLKTTQLKPGKLPIGPLVALAAAGLILGILLLVYEISKNPIAWQHALIISVAAILFARWVNLNHVSLHRYYRDRLMETFMPDVSRIVSDPYGDSHKSKSKEANSKGLLDMSRKEENGNLVYSGLYHIINTNVVLVASPKAKYRGRGGDNFILTPEYCGSNATGWCRTKDFMDGKMTLSSAMAISGAAVNPNTGCGGEGITRQPFLSTLMGILNLRLGYWVPNPNPQKRRWWIPRDPNYLYPGIKEILIRGLNEKSSLVQLSDGGHFENLALYELIRRRLGLIIVVDGGADPNYTFGDLGNAMGKVRADFGALVKIDSEDLKDLIPSRRGDEFIPAKKGFLIADIVYADNRIGKLIYINTTFCEGLSADLFAHKKDHPSFPEESTSNQFFDEKHFEAYRELGYQIALKMMDDQAKNGDTIVKNMMA